MPSIRVHRSPTFFWTAVIGVVCAHLIVCYPVAICRGYPPFSDKGLIDRVPKEEAPWH